MEERGRKEGGADVPDLAWRRPHDEGQLLAVAEEEEKEEELEEKKGGRKVCLGWVWRRLLDEGQLLVVAYVHVVVHGVGARVGRRHGHGGAVILGLQPQGPRPVTPPAGDTTLGVQPRKKMKGKIVTCE